MTNDKDIIKKLVKIAANQQKIINKLAQEMAQQTPSGAPPNRLEPGSPTKKEAQAILGALPPQVRAAVSQLEVHQGADANEVKVRFVPGKGSSMVFSALQRTIQSLQQSNVLSGSSYKITEVA